MLFSRTGTVKEPLITATRPLLPTILGPQSIDAKELVPGDMVLLEIGDRLPADLRIIKSVNLRVDESSLTGESESVGKDVNPTSPDTPLAERTSMAWTETTITNGRARGVVVATGINSEFGHIAQLTQTVGQESTPCSISFRY